MVNLSSFVFNSDFDSLKMNQTMSGSVSIPSSVLAGNAVAEWYTDVTVSKTPMDITYFSHSSINNRYRILTLQTGSINVATSTPYTVFVSSFYINSTTMRYKLEVRNPYSINISLTVMTVQFLSYTYEDPFN